MTLALTVGDKSHTVTVPRHRNLRVGTLNEIVGSVATFLGVAKREVREARALSREWQLPADALVREYELRSTA